MTAPLSPERWREVSPYLDRALEQAEDERGALLERLRAEDPSLAADLERLLASHQVLDRDGFLHESLLGKEPATSLAGQVLGAYTLVSPIGQGGMGSVWSAERNDGRFRGQVAVKLLNASLVGRDGEGRFRREGTILARLQHPHIAHLIDAGVSPQGQPYLVLERVDGERIDSYCDARGLAVPARLQLFLDVLAAVAHAHANLIVHRDLKPSNVLVGTDGQVKLLDFGIAKLLESDNGDTMTALTREGESVLTPEYAAPEQLTGGDVTTATDVYTLGVLLYVLLAGRHPAREGSQTPAELVRAIVDTAATRLSEAATTGARAVERAAQRATTPKRLRGALRGDLDNIVAKALKKHPAERYASADAMAEDLRRYLAHQPVSARADSVAYRTAKFVRRHAAGVALGGVGVLLLAGGAVRERTLRGRAEVEAQKARAVKEYLMSVFDVANPYAPPDQKAGDVTARALLDRGAARVDSTLAGEPDAQAELRGALGQVYTNLGLYDQAVPLLQRALEQRRALHGELHPAVAESMDLLGTVLATQNRFDQAEPLLREALEHRRALFGSTHAAIAESVDHLATLLQQRGDLAAAELLFREALATRKTLHGPDHQDVATSLNNLGVLLVLRGSYDEAEPLYDEALAITERRQGPDHPLTATTVHNLAQVHYLKGRFEESAALYRRALAIKRKTLGDAHPSVTVNLNNLAIMLAVEMGRVEEAETLVREALTLDRKIFGEHHAYVAESLANLGTVLRVKGDFDDAQRTYRQALEVNRSLWGDEHMRVASNLSNLAMTLLLQGDVEGAISLLRESHATCSRLVGEAHRTCTNVALNLGRALYEGGRVGEAEALFSAAAGRLQNASNPTQRAQLIRAQLGLGQILRGPRCSPPGLAQLEQALELSRQRFRAEDWRMAEVQLALGECLAAAGQQARAEPILREALTTLEPQRRGQPVLTRRADSALASIERDHGRR